MNVLQSSNEKYAGSLESWSDWIGKRVCISGSKSGILKYFGQTEFADGIWCGVELNDPVGKNNGTVKGVKYFTCKDNHGIFVSVSKVEKVREEETLKGDSEGRKKFKNRRFTLHSEVPRRTVDEETQFSLGDKRRKTTFFNFPKDNISRMSITSNSQKPQLNNSYVISTENEFPKDADDILNKTVVLTEENVNYGNLGKVSTDKIYHQKSSGLNTTFDIDNLQVLESTNDDDNNNNKETALDRTFVLDEQNLEGNQATLHSSISGTCNFKPNETDESLCILSLSQMKDFTICSEQFFNDGGAKFQNFQLTNTHNSNEQLRSESKPVSQILSSEFFQTDLKLCGGNTALEDSVFLHSEVENGNMCVKGLDRNSQDFLSRHSDEVKDICFQPTHVQSSTPSEESKHKFGKKVSLIKSLQLEDSFKDETKWLNSSTPNKPTPSEFLVQPNEFKSKADLPVQVVDNCLENINLSFIDSEAMPNVILDTTQLIQVEPLKQKEVMSDNCHAFDPILHPVEADNFAFSISDKNSNVRGPSEAEVLNFNVQDVPERVSQSAKIKSSECFQHLENVNLNVTQDLCPVSTVMSTTASYSDTEKLSVEVPLIVMNVKEVDGDSSIHKYKMLPVSKPCNAIDKVQFSREQLNGAIQRVPDLDKKKSCEAQNDFPNISKSIEMLSHKEVIPHLQPGCLLEIEEGLGNDILHQTFNYNSSYTIVQNNSNTVSGNEVYKYEVDVKNTEAVVINEVSCDSEHLGIVDQLYSVPSNQGFLSAENVCDDKNSTFVGNVTQNLNSTICISNNANSHNLTFDLTDNSKVENINTSRLNVRVNLTKQPVGPVPCKKNVYNKTVESKNSSLTNSSKPCVPSKREKAVSSLYAESVKQSTNVQSQKQENRRYSAAPRIMNSQNNKVQVKDQATSKINTNSRTLQLSLPRQSLGPLNAVKKQPESNSTVFKVPETKTVKNALNYQRIKQDARKENDSVVSQKCPPAKRRVITPSSSEKRSFILKENTQAVNVSLQNSEKDAKNGLPLPSLSRRSSTQSISSQSSSKIAVLNKNNSPRSIETKDFNCKNEQKLDTSARRQTVGVPAGSQRVNTSLRNQKLNDSTNSQKPMSSNSKEKQNSAIKKPEGQRVSGRLSECGPKRINTTKVSATPPKIIRPCQEVKKKWVSKAELVKEIQNLGASCESKTKEMNFAKIQLRKATLGFEALAVLINYVNEEMDPFSQIRLFKEMANTEAALKVTGAQLKCYLTQLELINNSHKENVGGLAEKLETAHRKELKKLKKKHSLTLEKSLVHCKDEVIRTKKNFEKQTLERKEHIELVLRELNQDLEKQRREQKNKHDKAIHEIKIRHEEVENRLKSQVRNLCSQIELVEIQTKQAEEKFFKDKSSKVQRALAKTIDLQKESESLKAVLEMKNSQVKEVIDRNAQMKEQLQELNKCREEIFNLEKETNDVQQILREKTHLQRELAMRTHDLQVSREKESKAARRMNLENEELKWRLCESMTKKRTSSSVFEPRTESRRSLRSGYRSTSLSVLHSGRDENNSLMTSSMPASTSEGQPKTKPNRMSISLVSTLPSYEESSASGSTPKRNRSSSVKPSPSKYFRFPTRRASSFRDYISNNPLRFMKNSLRESMFYVSSPDQDLPGFQRKKNSISWTIDDMSDYYEDMDGGYLYVTGGENNESESSSTNGESSEASVSYKQMERNCDDTNSDSFSTGLESRDGESKGCRKKAKQGSRIVPRSRSLMDDSIVGVYEARGQSESYPDDFMEEVKSFEFLGAGEKVFPPKEPQRPTGLPRSFSCATSGSLNEKYSTLREKIDQFCHSDLALNGSSASSNSSNSMSPEPVASEKKAVLAELPGESKSGDTAAAGVAQLAGECAVHDAAEPPSNTIRRSKFYREMASNVQGDLKLPTGHSAMDSSFSSEDAKDRAGNSVSFSTVSIESSSCTTMTDSTNIDISWGDDECPSDNAK